MWIRTDIGSILFRILTFIIIFCIFFPIFVTIVVSFNKAGFLLPPSGFTLKWYIRALKYKGFISGMYVSFIVALLASGISTLIGTLTSFALVRYQFRGKDFLNTFFLSPLMMPVVIMGLAIYSFLVKLGMPESVFSLIIGHVVLITPFSIRTITASLQNFDRSLEEAAMNVGASHLKTFFSVTLPIIKTGIIAGMMMAFILSWNNFALSVFLASPRWTPLPLELLSYIKFEFDATGAALSSLLVFLSGIAIVAIDRLIGLSTVMGLKTD